MKANNQYYKSLTGFRAIAAFMVFLHHYNPFPSSNKFTLVLHDFTSELHVGVTFFFVLSGFLIATRYMDMKNFVFKTYMINRVARIYPMYFILTFILFADYVFHNPSNLFNKEFYIQVLTNFTFLKGYIPTLIFSGISQGWSLTVEETFYLLAPIFFLILQKSKIQLIIIPIVLISMGFIVIHLLKNHINLGMFSLNEFYFNYTFFGRCAEFFIGISLAIIVRSNKNFKFYNSITYIGLVLVIFFIYLISINKGSADLGIRTPIGKLINTLLLPLIGISTLYYGLIKEQTILSKILSSKLFVLLGKSSYIFYLIHLGIFYGILHKFFNNNLIVFLLLNLLSVGLYLYVENPFNQLIRKRFASNYLK